MAKKKLTPEQEALFPKPTREEQALCCVCSDLAPWGMRDLRTGDKTDYCSLHVPEEFNEFIKITRPLAREFEEEFLKNNSTGSASNAPADNTSSQ